MFNIIFGTIWTVFSSIFLFAMLAAESAGAGSGNFGIALIVVLLFMAIGIGFLISGFKMMFKNRKTDKHGKEAYGIILDILPTGSHVNGRPEMKADVLVYDGFVSDVYSEITGFNRYKYNIGDYLVIKLYEGDINIVKKIDQSRIPSNILEKINEEYAKKYNPAFMNSYNAPFINPMQNVPPNNPIVNQIQNMSPVQDTVVINGVEYVRKQKNNSNNNQENNNENRSETNSDNPFTFSGFDKF